MFNSEVKITDANGLLVNTIQSNGGQAVWNGKNLTVKTFNQGLLFFCYFKMIQKSKRKVLVVR